MSADFVTNPINGPITNGQAMQVNMVNRKVMGVQVNATVDSTAKTAAASVLASLVLQDITYVAVDRGGLNAGGNSITVAYTTGGTAGSEVVTVSGAAISVQIASGVSTATQVNTALTAAGSPVSALVTHSVTGTGSNAQVAVAATHLTGGTNSAFNLIQDTISITADGFFTGQVVQATKSGAAFPTGIAASTNYFIFTVDPNTIALFDTFAHALAATATNGVPYGTGLIVISSDASFGSTITFTPTAISGASYKLQKSMDWNPQTKTGNWIDVVSTETLTVVTNTITTSANSYASCNFCSAAWLQVVFAISAGSAYVQVYANPKQE